MDWEIDFGKRLKASQSASIQRVSIYLADTNRRDEPIDLTHWVDRCVHLFVDLNDGCTRLPLAFGAFRDQDGSIFEHTVVVYSYITDPRRFHDRFNELVAFVHDFGRVTEQKAVMVEFAGGSMGSYFSRAYFVGADDFIDFEATEDRLEA